MSTLATKYKCFARDEVKYKNDLNLKKNKFIHFTVFKVRIASPKPF